MKNVLCNRGFSMVPYLLGLLLIAGVFIFLGIGNLKKTQTVLVNVGKKHSVLLDQLAHQVELLYYEQSAWLRADDRAPRYIHERRLAAIIHEIERILAEMDDGGLPQNLEVFTEGEKKSSSVRTLIESTLTLHDLIMDKALTSIDEALKLSRWDQYSLTEIVAEDLRKRSRDIAEELYLMNQRVHRNTVFVLLGMLAIFFLISFLLAGNLILRRRAEEERKKLQSQLLQAQKMESVGILAGGVAHDFNNLLHAMRGNIELLGQEENLDPDSAARLETVVKSIDRAALLVQQLLLFSRKAEFKRKHIDLNAEVEGVVRILERTIPKMISLELYLDPDIHPVSADPVQIEQVLLNLAANAVDAMPDEGKLFIETSNVFLDEDFVRVHPDSAAGPHVLLTVTDTGCGMDKKVLDHVFDPFFTTKEAGKGTGLGLATVYGIVKAHGGHIQCYSEPNRGTMFKIYLPAAQQDDDLAGEYPRETSVKGGTETILVVDDDADIQELTQEILEMLGYNVMTALSGEQALSIYSEQGSSIDLVLLDLNMPGMGGYSCLRELLRLDPQVKVVIASGYAPNSLGKNALSSGAKGFIGKPYQMKDLAATVRGVLDEKDQGQPSPPKAPG